MVQPNQARTRVAKLLVERSESTPSYVGYGVGGSLATHALAAGGYTLYLLCAAWLTNADLPEWMPPQAGVVSRPQATSQAIVLEASSSEPTERNVRLIATTRARAPMPDTPTLAAATLEIQPDQTAISVASLDHVDFVSQPSEAQPSTPAVQRAVSTDLEWDRGEAKPTPLPRPARVSRRGEGRAIQSVTSVASAPSLESHGVESDALPQQLYNPEPDYPAAQYTARIGGTVKIRIQLHDDGHVLRATVHRTSGVPALDSAALAAVRQWRFEPVSTRRRTTRELIFPIRFEPPR